MCPIQPNNFCIFQCVNENSEPDGNYTAAGVIDGAAMAFQNILSAFPPCWTAAKQTYQQIFVGPILSDGFLANGIIFALQGSKLSSKWLISIFYCSQMDSTRDKVFSWTSSDAWNNCCYRAVLIPPKWGSRKTPRIFPTFVRGSRKTRRNIRFASLLRFPHTQWSCTLFIFSFSRIVPAIETQRKNRSTLPSHGSVGTDIGIRFGHEDVDVSSPAQPPPYVLYSFSNSHFRFARCPNGKIVPVKLPLIGSFLWSDDEHHQINYTTKRIIKLFIDHVSVDFPADKVAILSVS